MIMEQRQQVHLNVRRVKLPSQQFQLPALPDRQNSPSGQRKIDSQKQIKINILRPLSPPQIDIQHEDSMICQLTFIPTLSSVL